MHDKRSQLYLKYMYEYQCNQVFLIANMHCHLSGRWPQLSLSLTAFLTLTALQISETSDSQGDEDNILGCSVMQSRRSIPFWDTALCSPVKIYITSTRQHMQPSDLSESSLIFKIHVIWTLIILYHSTTVTWSSWI